MLKIPFGKDKLTGMFYDAGMVPNGNNCNCICNECGADLQAVHPKLHNRQKYFRHSVVNDCAGGLESLFHMMAKQILRESHCIRTGHNSFLEYISCDIETPRHGKCPDAYISDENSSIVVEIFFYHRIEQDTLDAYLKNNEKVLEIDISSERKQIFKYDYLKDLVLQKAPRKMYINRKEDDVENLKRDENISGWILGGLLVLGAIVFKSLNGHKRNSRY